MFSERDYNRYDCRTPEEEARLSGPNSVVFKLIAVNAVIFFLSRVMPDLNARLCLHAPAVVNGQFWRLLTYMFAHAGFWHLFFNMYGLHLFGKMLLPELGTSRFLGLYFTSGLLGGLCWVLANLHTPYFCVGASGALFGLMVAAAISFPNVRMLLLFPPIPIKLRTLVIIYCLLEIVMLGEVTGVAHLAHLGGALGGLLFMRREKNRGDDAYSPRSSWLERLQRLFRTKPEFTCKNPTEEKPDTEEINRILDKISQQGFDNLTEQEKAALRAASETLRARK